MVIQEMKSGVTGMTNAIGSKLKDSLSFLKEMKEAGEGKITLLVNDILGLAPLIEVTGFNMKELNLEAGVPPGISLLFLKEKAVDASTIEALLHQNEDKPLLNLIVGGLQKADALQNGLNLSHYKFQGLFMKISLPPLVTLRFLRTETVQNVP